ALERLLSKALWVPARVAWGDCHRHRWMPPLMSARQLLPGVADADRRPRHAKLALYLVVLLRERLAAARGVAGRASVFAGIGRFIGRGFGIHGPGSGKRHRDSADVR